MKIRFIAVVSAVLVQAASAHAEVARPVAVNVDLGGLSAVSSQVSQALSSGDLRRADELLSGIYSGGVRAEAPEAVKPTCCCCQCGAAAPAPAADAAPAPTPKPQAGAQASSKPPAPTASASSESSGESKKEKEEAAKQKAFNWGVTIMTLALLAMFVLL